MTEERQQSALEKIFSSLVSKIILTALLSTIITWLALGATVSAKVEDLHTKYQDLETKRMPKIEETQLEILDQVKMFNAKMDTRMDGFYIVYTQTQMKTVELDANIKILNAEIKNMQEDLDVLLKTE